ncbi:MAG: hypothetical protein ACO3ST_09840, partial [Burkholderiaceae bacterium]
MIDSVRQTVLSILNKNNYGYISPSDFNLYAKQAQLEVFESYFTGLNQAINAENARMSGTEYADMSKGISEAINVFSVTNPLTQSPNPATPNVFFAPSQTTTGDDYYLLNKVLAGGIEAEPVSHSKITMLNASLLTAPSTQFPAYTLQADSITVFPATFNQPGDVNAQYIRYPFDPKWTYVSLVGGEPVFDQSQLDFQAFELPIEDEPRLVYRILHL